MGCCANSTLSKSVDLPNLVALMNSIFVVKYLHSKCGAAFVALNKILSSAILGTPLCRFGILCELSSNR